MRINSDSTKKRKSDIKILSINTGSSDFFGGQAFVVLHLTRQFIKEGYRNSAILGNINSDINWVGDIRCYKLRYLRILDEYLPLNWFRIRKIINQYDIIFVHNPLHLLGILSLLINCRNKKVISIFHSFGGSSKTHYLKRFLYMLRRVLYTNIAFLFSSKLIFMTQYAKDYFNNLAKLNHSISQAIIPNGYPSVPVVKKIKPLDKIKIVYLGTLSKDKGILDLLSIAPYLDHKKVSLDIAGNGSLRSAVILNPFVTYKGEIETSQVLDFLSDYHVLVLPTYTDNQPIVLIEAMKVGLAVLTTNVDGISEIITDGVNGFLFRAGDKGQLLKIIDRLNKRKLRIISKNNFEESKKYNLVKQARSYLTFSLTSD